MKKNLSFTILYFISALVLFSCRREIAAEQENRQTDFTSAAAKEWYYSTFKKSAEWQESTQKGKKLPEWNYPSVSKLGSTEFVEYPLKKGRSSYPITPTDFSGKALDVQQTVRTAEASTSKIVFFKQPSGSVIVREFDYIPDWDYLVAKNFDIGNSSIIRQHSDFTGRVIVKNWKGDIINMAYYENGIAKKRGRKADKSASLNPGTPIDNENCHEAQFCVWQQDCDLWLYSDGMVSYECTAWYNTGECWMEYWCDEGGDPCEVAGIGCHDDGGGDFPPACNMDCSEALNQLNSITTEEPNVVNVNDGTPGPPDGNGIERKPKNITWEFFRLNFGLGFYAAYSALFNGIVFKNANSPTWKWESLVYNQTAQTGGSIPMCLSVTTTASVSGPVISTDKLRATTSLTYISQVTISCALGVQSKTYTETINNQDFLAN